MASDRVRRWGTAALGAALITIVSVSTAHAAQGPFNRPDSSPASAHVASARVVPSVTDDAGTAESRSAPGRYIRSVEWIPDPHGRRLAVFPTDYARHDAPLSAWPQAWDEVIRVEPDADRQKMRDQFRCHVEFARIAAPDKPSWNLELWRPDVGYLATVLGACNPE